LAWENIRQNSDAIDAVKNASVEDLMQVKGVTAEIAVSLKELL